MEVEFMHLKFTKKCYLSLNSINFLGKSNSIISSLKSYRLEDGYLKHLINFKNRLIFNQIDQFKIWAKINFHKSILVIFTFQNLKKTQTNHLN